MMMISILLRTIVVQLMITIIVLVPPEMTVSLKMLIPVMMLPLEVVLPVVVPVMTLFPLKMRRMFHICHLLIAQIVEEVVYMIMVK